MDDQETLAALNIKLGERKESLSRMICEAQNQLSEVPPTKRRSLKIIQDFQVQETMRLGEVFDALTDNPCFTCPPMKNCCRPGDAPSGFFYPGDFHKDILMAPTRLTELVVPFRLEEVTNGEVTLQRSRCIFLSPSGCNIPRHYRSHTCVRYCCSDLERALIDESGELPGRVHANKIAKARVLKAKFLRNIKKTEASNKENPSGRKGREKQGQGCANVGGAKYSPGSP